MRTIIVGLHNPYSDDPANALAPHPEGCSGHRLWKTLSEIDAMAYAPCHSALRASYDRRHYMSLFDRRNLCATEAQTRSRSRMEILADTMSGAFERDAVVVLLGKTVLRAFNDAGAVSLKPILIHPQVDYGVTWRWLPHPSGRSTVYNDPVVKTLVGMMLADLITVQESRNAT
jgi:hypothetical protein